MFGRRRTLSVPLLGVLCGICVTVLNCTPPISTSQACQFERSKAGVGVGVFTGNESVVTASQWALNAWTPGPKAPPIVAPQGAADVFIVSYSDPIHPQSAYTSIASADPAGGIAPSPKCGTSSWAETPVIWANTAIFEHQALGSTIENMGRIGHELGHAYGLAHPKPEGSAFGGCGTSDNSLMWWDRSAFRLCSTSTLQAPDILGLSFLYD